MADEKKRSTSETDPKNINSVENTPESSSNGIDIAGTGKDEIPPIDKKLGTVEAKQKIKADLGFKMKPEEQTQGQGQPAGGEAEGKEMPEVMEAPEPSGGGTKPQGPQGSSEQKKPEQPETSGKEPISGQKSPAPSAGSQKSPQEQGQNQSGGGQQSQDGNQKKPKDEEKEKKKKDEEEEAKKKEEEEEKAKKDEEEKAKGEEEKPPTEDETAPAGEEKKPAETSEEGPEAEGAQPEGAESGEATDELGEALESRAERETGAQAIQAGTKAGEKAAGTGTATAGAEARALARIKTVLKAARLFLGSWPVVLVIIGVILLFIFIVWIIGILIPRTHTDTGNPEDKAAIEEVVSLSASNKITFTKTDDLDKIKKGEIGKTSVQMMAYLAKKHEKIEINYNNQNYNGSTSLTTGGSTKSTSSTAKTLPAGENEPFEFDVVSVDSIKCANSTGAKLSPIPINLSSSFNWTSLLKKEYNNTIICAVGYYPGETKVSGSFSAQLGPGEFSILDISSAGPKAAREKMAEVTSEMLKIDSSGATSKNGSLLPLKITLDSGYAKDTGTNSGVVGVLKNQIIAAYPTATSKDEGVIAGNPLYGIHVNYL